MKDYQSKNIINIALAGHASSGKTIISETILFNNKVIHKRGSIDAGTTVSDYRDQEKSNQHSVAISLMNFESADKKINLIDCPGSLDFVGDMVSGIVAGDCTAIVVSSVDGVEVGTELAWEYSSNKAKAVFINLLDRDQSKFDQVLSSMKTTFGRSVFPLTLPVDEGENFSQVADVLSKAVHSYSSDGSGTFTNVENADWGTKLDSLKSELIELIAESDENLLDKYLENGELSDEDISTGFKKAMVDGSIIPVFCMSGQKNVGLSRAMEVITSYFPVASDFESQEGGKPGNEEKSTRKISSNEPLSAVVFKTINEEHVGELSFMKVYSGEVKSGVDTNNVNTNASQKLRQVYFLNGNKRVDSSGVVAGDIAAVLKLKDTHTGDSLCDPKSPFQFNPINFPSPNVNYAVAPKDRGSEDKIATGLSLAHEEDPTFIYRVDPELKQTILSGQGDVHIDMNLEKIKTRFNVELIKSRPRVPYRETITGNAEAKYRHKKQSGGAGQFAEVWLRIAPSERGSGIDFKESLVGQNVDRGFVPSVEKGIQALCTDGIISGCKVVDVKIDFYDGKMHPVDSNDMAFQLAGKNAFIDAFKSARPKILEPIYKIEVNVPDEFMGDIMGDVSQRRGRVSGTDAQGTKQIIKAEIPLSNLHDYATSLKSMTSARGRFSQEFSHYEDMPQNEADKVISEYEASKQQSE